MALTTPPAPAGLIPENRARIRRVRRVDRLAAWLITAGGLMVIVSVLGILILIAGVAAPLFKPARAERLELPAAPAPAAEPLAVGADEYLENGYVLDRRGVFSFYGLERGELLGEEPLTPPTATAGEVRQVDTPAVNLFSIEWEDGSLTLARVRFAPGYDAAGERTIERELENLGSMPAPAGARPRRSLLRGDAGNLTRVSLLEGNAFAVTRQATSTDLFGESSTAVHEHRIEEALPGRVTAFTVDQDGEMLLAGTDTGHLVRWELREGEAPRRLDQARVGEAAISALAMVLGDVSVAVGDEAGGYSTWSDIAAQAGQPRRLARTHTLRPHPSAIRAIVPSPRDKSLLSLGADGALHLDHMTSERHLLAMAATEERKLPALNSRANAILSWSAGEGLSVWSLSNPHPEVSLKSLFGRVWYESYAEPDFVWQSSGGTGDFEPKLSLVPLIFGTLKGTFYAMLLALPLAVLGAVYTSQFMRPGLRRWVKPAVEIMAAVPSVVIGFLAALWLAPLVDGWFTTLALGLALIPTMLLLAMLGWQRLEEIPAVRRHGRGHEFLLLAPVVGAACLLALWAGPALELHLMGGSFSQWLYETFNERYDQRNSIIIAFALGFAVIPIIFTISDDALSNVPRHLTAASLALGASRWQTAWRVVLPSASPGIFAGAMIGFGRAVGETMIVLMATGNTPILDWSPFNGMRTLSANIAVEIPEAPVASTLYRVLFLTAVILFLMTFFANTVAEVVRQRLRKKYGQL